MTTLCTSAVLLCTKGLLKIIAGADFINILCTAFTHSNPSSAKRQSSHQCLLILLGSVGAKAAHRMLAKLTPGVNFINVLHTAFTLIDPESVKKLTT